MIKNAILFKIEKLNDNLFLYKPIDAIVGEYENDGKNRIFKANNDGQIKCYRRIDDIATNFQLIDKYVGYPINDEDLLKKYNEETYASARKKYLNDIKSNIIFSIKDMSDNKFKIRKINIKDIKQNMYSYSELNKTISNLTNYINETDYKMIEPLLKEIRRSFVNNDKIMNEIFYRESDCTEISVHKKEFTDLITNKEIIEEKCAKEVIRIKNSIKEPLEKLNNLIGLKEVKDNINVLQSVLLRDIKVKNFVNTEPRYFNMIFTGNPGTGKTTVASIYAELLYKLGFIKYNKITKIGSQDLIGKYVGHTADKTQKLLEKARGGVIILDEAYTLAADGQKFRDDALGIILKEMERPDTVFIFAGYEKEMEKLVNANSGLVSRIQYFIHFVDYSKEELMQILINEFNKASITDEHKFKIDDEAYLLLLKLIEKESKTENFGNGRYIKNLFDNIIKKQSFNTIDSFDYNRLFTIMPEDVPTDTVYQTNKQKTIGFMK